MSAPEGCEHLLLTQAEFDGELDAAQAVALRLHRQDCPICRAAEAELSRNREVLSEPGLYRHIPEALRDAITMQVRRRDAPAPAAPAVRRASSWRFGWPLPASFALGAACAAAVAIFVVAPGQQGLVDQIVASHIRALQPGHLEDVPSSDQHTVKPWFDGRLDYAPPVKDLASAGFPLKGGRLDYVAGRPVAALVYQSGKHLIDLFVYPATAGSGRAPATAEDNGYNVVHWSQGGMIFWAVSDLEPSRLRDFAATWRRAPG